MRRRCSGCRRRRRRASAPGPQVRAALRVGVGPRHLGRRLLHGLRLLEARLHPPGRLRPLRGRGGRRRPGHRSTASRRRSASSSRWRPTRWRRRREPRADRDLRGPPRARPARTRCWSSRSRAGSTPGWARPPRWRRCWARGRPSRVVTFNGEHFLDQRARRPVAHIVNGITTELNWPRTMVRHGHRRERGRHALPGRPRAGLPLARLLRRRGRVWPAPGGCARWSVSGAFPAPAPHTRPVRLAATAPRVVGPPDRTGGDGAGRARGAGRGVGRAGDGLRRPGHAGGVACGPGCPTTWRGCRSPRRRRS